MILPQLEEKRKLLKNQMEKRKQIKEQIFQDVNKAVNEDEKTWNICFETDRRKE